LKRFSLGSLLFLFVFFTANLQAAARNEDFTHWLAELRTEARTLGISTQTLDQSLQGLKAPLARVVELDRTQPEFQQSLLQYLASRVTPARIAAGKQMKRRYPTWLGRVEKAYGVQRDYILALWGIETSYGRHTGNISVIHALATLAHDGRRASYFRRELFEALRIIDAGHIGAPLMQGSWAGAMGQCQFMPSSFARYAVDADQDGRINIWNSIPDVFASSANYLQQAGWQAGQPWGQLVGLPANFPLTLAGLDQQPQPISHWRKLGVKSADQRALPAGDLAASLILPAGEGGPAYLVYANFHVLLKWNRSSSFAIAVGSLADKIAE
jgi:membrane-bound lytic murein transglycosylase B